MHGSALPLPQIRPRGKGFRIPKFHMASQVVAPTVIAICQMMYIPPANTIGAAIRKFCWA